MDFSASEMFPETPFRLSFASIALRVPDTAGREKSQKEIFKMPVSPQEDPPQESKFSNALPEAIGSAFASEGVEKNRPHSPRAY
jgi:hypothetical protein